MGNATVICSGKTGTLTENVITVVAGTLGSGDIRFDDRNTLAARAPDATFRTDEKNVLESCQTELLPKGDAISPAS